MGAFLERITGKAQRAVALMQAAKNGESSDAARDFVSASELLTSIANESTWEPAIAQSFHAAAARLQSAAKLRTEAANTGALDNELNAASEQIRQATTTVMASHAIQNCSRKGGSEPATAQLAPRKLTKFLGVNLQAQFNPKLCTVEQAFRNTYQYGSVVCEFKSTETHTIYVEYLTDNRFPTLRGRLIRVYAVLANSVFEDQSAMKGYLDAATDKYGSLGSEQPDGRRYSEGKLQICSEGDTQCDNAIVALDKGATFNSPALALADHIARHEPSVFVEFSLLNATLSNRVNDFLSTEKQRRAAAAVE